MEMFDWGWLIVIYLFFGGLGAGAYFVSGLATYLGNETTYRSIARWGAYLAPFPIIIGSGLLIFDLFRPWNFYRLFLTIQLTSPMSIGSWILMAFSVVSLVNGFLWLPRETKERLFSHKWPGKLKRLVEWSWELKTQENLRNLFAALGLPLSAGVALYTGILLGAIPARPFWNTPMLAQLFLFSGISTGTAAVIVLTSFTREHALSGDQDAKLLYTLDILLICLEILIIVPFLLHAYLATASIQNSLHLIMGGPYTFLFWGVVVLAGLLVPLLVEIYEIYPMVLKKHMHHSRILEVASGILVLVGGLTLRYVFVFGGQLSAFDPKVASLGLGMP
jgi:formate-dependent nitrite reductase membrane component NrfD